jgi:hypothetical protein
MGLTRKLDYPSESITKKHYEALLARPINSLNLVLKDRHNADNLKTELNAGLFERS